MPTPESAEAFAKLVATRTRLTEVTKLLNECHEVGSRQRYDQLQAEWDSAYKEFQTATDAFSATVKKLPEMVISHRLPTPQNSH
jgi:hypothetical protein